MKREKKEKGKEIRRMGDKKTGREPMRRKRLKMKYTKRRMKVGGGWKLVGCDQV